MTKEDILFLEQRENKNNLIFKKGDEIIEFPWKIERDTFRFGREEDSNMKNQKISKIFIEILEDKEDEYFNGNIKFYFKENSPTDFNKGDIMRLARDEEELYMEFEKAFNNREEYEEFYKKIDFLKDSSIKIFIADKFGHFFVRDSEIFTCDMSEEDYSKMFSDINEEDEVDEDGDIDWESRSKTIFAYVTFNEKIKEETERSFKIFETEKIGDYDASFLENVRCKGLATKENNELDRDEIFVNLDKVVVGKKYKFKLTYSKCLSG